MENLYNTGTVNNLIENRGPGGKVVKLVTDWLESIFSGSRIAGRGYKTAFKKVNEELPFTWWKGVPGNIPFNEIWRVVSPFNRATSAEVNSVKKYLTRVSPVPNGAVNAIRKELGLGPAIFAFSYGLFLRYLSLVLVLTWCRLIISIITMGTPEEVKEWFDENLGIQPWESADSDTWVTNVLKNFGKSMYFPDVAFTVPGYVILPYVYAAIDWCLRDAPKQNNPVDYIIGVHDRAKSGIMSIVGMTQKIPQNLLEQFPQSERDNVKMDGSSIYWSTPEYPITNFGGGKSNSINLNPSPDDYAILIPGDGWYRIKDVDFE